MSVTKVYAKTLDEPGVLYVYKLNGHRLLTKCKEEDLDALLREANLTLVESEGGK